jgi:hypothetical protein
MLLWNWVYSAHKNFLETAVKTTVFAYVFWKEPFKTHW